MSMTEQEEFKIDQETQAKLNSIMEQRKKQRDYNQKWLSKLTPEQRKEYFRLKARTKRNWKCSRCSKPLANDIGYKPLGTNEKICETCIIKEIIQRKREEENKNGKTHVASLN
jgi:hypothetical protein